MSNGLVEYFNDLPDPRGSSPKVAVKIHIFPHHLIFTD